MADRERPIREFRKDTTGAYFDVIGGNIQAAISAKIHDQLNVQIQRTLDTIVSTLPDTKGIVAYMSAICTMKSADDLAPHVAQVYQLCRHLQALTEEVAELQQIGRNIFTDETYRLGLAELKRFGL